MNTEKPKRSDSDKDLRISPERRLCPRFDFTSIAEYQVAPRDEMGFRVLDNCVEDHIM